MSTSLAEASPVFPIFPFKLPYPAIPLSITHPPLPQWPLHFPDFCDYLGLILTSEDLELEAIDEREHAMFGFLSLGHTTLTIFSIPFHLMRIS